MYCKVKYINTPTTINLRLIYNFGMYGKSFRQDALDTFQLHTSQKKDMAYYKSQ